MMHFLFPSSPFNKAAADDDYLEEYAAARAAGFSCHLFSFEDFESGSFKPRPALVPGEPVIYRGWMLTPEMYARLCLEIVATGGLPLTDPARYKLCHYLPEWYPVCAEFTPPTLVLPRNADFVAAVADTAWPAFFVKDYVKSLTTARGSVAAVPEEIENVVSLIEKFRGSVEGGVCVRRFEDWQAGTEERHFVYGGQPYAKTGKIPPLVLAIAGKIDSPFFSIDTILSKSGEMRLVELGDGQVSDRKSWPTSEFFAMFTPS